MKQLLYGIITMLVLTHSSQAQNELREDNIALFRPVWSYHPGDDMAWADPNYTEIGWEPLIDTYFQPGDVPANGWVGNGWFRSEIEIDPSVVGLGVSYVMYLQGAAQIYLDGLLIDFYGVVGPSVESEEPARNVNPRPVVRTITFEEPGRHLLAVRVSNHVLADVHIIGGPIGGFDLRFGLPVEMLVESLNRVRLVSALQYLFTGIPGVLAVVFLLLFAFSPRQFRFFFFGLFCLAVATLVYLEMQSAFIRNGDVFLRWRRYHGLALSASMVVLVRFLYAALYDKMPWTFWIVFVLGLIGGISIWFDPFGGFGTLVFTILLGLAEATRLSILALLQRVTGSWLLGIGITVLAGAVLYDLMVSLEWIIPVAGIQKAYYMGAVGLAVSHAGFLGVSVAESNRQLETRLAETRSVAEQNLKQERDARRREIKRVRTEAESREKSIEVKQARNLAAASHRLEKAQQELNDTRERLEHTEEMASLGRLTAGIGHEMRNPLNLVNNLTGVSKGLLSEVRTKISELRITDDEALTELRSMIRELVTNLERIAQYGKRVDATVSRMMRYASGDQSDRTLTEINKLVEQYLKLAYHAMQVEFPDFEVSVERDYEHAVEQIVVSPDRLGKALVSLFRNAFEAVHAFAQYAPSGYVPRVWVTTRRMEEYVLIRVRDNGPGVPEEAYDRVFDSFFTTKKSEEGTGLGLSTAQDIVVNEHGGTIGVETLSTEGAGFYITLPATE